MMVCSRLASAARGLVCFLALVVAGCGDLTLPTPPDLSPLAEQYGAPTAELGPSTAPRLLDRYFQRREQLSRIDDLKPLTRSLVDFERNVTTSDEGGHDSVAINGIPIPTDAVLTVTGSCPEAEDAGASHVSLKLVVRASRLIPVTWGAVRDCVVRRDVAGMSVVSRFDASVDVALQSLESRSGLPTYLVSYELDELEIGEKDQEPFDGDFRLIGESIEVLVNVVGIGTAVVSASRPGAPVLGVRASNGEWLCDLEEKRCEDPNSQSSSFSY